jgi:hypothetical protein
MTVKRAMAVRQEKKLGAILAALFDIKPTEPPSVALPRPKRKRSRGPSMR